ncbi:MAG: hypothetical protein ACHP9Z_14935 [Streptosporangiales bacterium]
MAIATVNPATGEIVKTHDEMSENDVERRLTAASAAHASYRLTSFDSRAGWDAPGRPASALPAVLERFFETKTSFDVEGTMTS